MIDYLWTGHLPEDVDEVDRVKELAQRYRAHGNKLQIKAWTPLGQTWVEVPPVPTRKKLVIDTHHTLGHCGRDKVVDTVRLDFWWPGMHHDIASVLAKCEVCQKDKIPKQPKDNFNFIFKGNRPFLGWALDIAGRFAEDA